MNTARHPIHTLLILTVTLALLLAAPSTVLAQESESESFEQEIATIIPEEEGIEEVVISEDVTPIGVVDEIILKGELVTSRGAVLRQMTFKVGDEITLRDISLCRGRLLGFNAIYWYADITWEPTEEEGHIAVTVDLRARRTWFFSPATTGLAIGDRNAFGTADTITVAYFASGDDYYYSVGWLDPQWLGGHNSMYMEGHVLDGAASIRTDDLYSTGESYLIDRNGFSMTYRTSWSGRTSVGVGYRWDDVSTVKYGDPFAGLGTDDTFYLSGASIADGRIGVLNFQLGSASLNSFFFPTSGYYWGINNEFANSLTLSDYDFTRHHFWGAAFLDLHKGRNVLCGRVMYSYLTGDAPDYEQIPFDWQVRGYTGATHRGKSLVAFNFEYRFRGEPEIFDGVLFADFGRSWDGHKLSIKDLEYGYGGGIRIYTAPFIPYNLLLRIDYAFGSNGEELLIGFNQFL